MPEQAETGAGEQPVHRWHQLPRYCTDPGRLPATLSESMLFTVIHKACFCMLTSHMLFTCITCISS